MTLSASCPRCPRPVTVEDGLCVCPTHGRLEALWRPALASYDDFGMHLLAARDFPTWLRWPMPANWSVSDFGRVGNDETLATVTCVTGTHELDGPVDLCVVTEEPGTGLGARVAGLAAADPGPEVGQGPPTARVRLGGHPVLLWPVSTSAFEGELDRSVLVGEGQGRWLWLVLRPASALLALQEEWSFDDAAGIGPALLEVEFTGPPQPW